jgi:hypothetical protein
MLIAIAIVIRRALCMADRTEPESLKGPTATAAPGDRASAEVSGLSGRIKACVFGGARASAS